MAEQTPPIWPTDRHPGQAKREPGSYVAALEAVTIPDKASPFRGDARCGMTASLKGKRRLRMHEPPVLAVMTKAPVCGAVNTRLASEIGPVAATALARTLTAALLRQVAGDPRFRTILAISPDEAVVVCPLRVDGRYAQPKKRTGSLYLAQSLPFRPSGAGAGIAEGPAFQGVRSRIRLRLPGDGTDVEPGAFRYPRAEAASGNACSAFSTDAAGVR